MFHVLREHLGVPRNHIRFLHIWSADDGFVVPYGTIDAQTTKTQIKYTLNTWLQSTSSDNVLLFIFSHGSGYLAEANAISSAATKEIGGDEGDEILESTYGQDVNGDGDKNDWFGVDESLVLVSHDLSQPPEYYSDDELKSDLQNVQCNQMTIIMSCCFAGGFIDNLSAPNWIIITSSSETKTTTPSDVAGFTPFIGHFLDAFNGDVFHRYHAVWNEDDVNNRIVDTYEITVPDRDCNGVDWRNAYAYARDQFPYDSPWFDSNGNELPTYKNGQNYIEYFLWIWHNYGGYTTPNTGGYEYPAGTIVSVTAIPSISGYGFDHWVPDDIPWFLLRYGYPTWSPYTYTMNQDRLIKAYFYPEGGGGGGGDGCPTLYTWNGSAYVDYGVIDIHDLSGEDMVKEVSIAKQDLAVEDRKVKLRLEEGWLGLNFSESVIDQVKLYVIDEDGKLKLCPLTTAVHSRLGDVRKYVVASDDVKAQTLLLETIDLTFKVREDSQGFIFVIEGCNQLKQ